MCVRTNERMNERWFSSPTCEHTLPNQNISQTKPIKWLSYHSLGKTFSRHTHTSWLMLLGIVYCGQTHGLYLNMYLIRTLDNNTKTWARP
jgi:hypothetical protein